MRDYYVFDITQRKGSRFDGQPYYELDIVSIDPYDKHLKTYKTYAVSGYKNYKKWLPIINAKQKGIAVWFCGEMRLKPYQDNVINADSTPNYEGAVSTEKLCKFFEHNINLGNIKNTRPQKELSDIGKVFFEI
jgi:hypothetical protein